MSAAIPSICGSTTGSPPSNTSTAAGSERSQISGLDAWRSSSSINSAFCLGKCYNVFLYIIPYGKDKTIPQAGLSDPPRRRDPIAPGSGHGIGRAQRIQGRPGMRRALAFSRQIRRQDRRHRSMKLALITNAWYPAGIAAPLRTVRLEEKKTKLENYQR